MPSEHANGFHDPSANPEVPNRTEGSATPGSNGATNRSSQLDHTTNSVKTTIDSFHIDPENEIYPMVSVKWKDAESQGGPSWEDAQEMLEFAQKPLVLVHTVGQLLHIDEEKIAITDTISGEQMGGVTKIPRMWIMELSELAPREEAQDSPLCFTDENGNERNRSVG